MAGDGVLAKTRPPDSPTLDTLSQLGARVMLAV